MINLLIVCHVEFGYADPLVVYDRRHVEGVRDGVRNAISIAEEFNAKISLMLMPETLEAIGELDLARHEIGLHIHPHDSFLGSRNVGGSCQLGSYSYERQKDMIFAGKKAIEDSLGVSPRSFVAGKWSISNDTIKALVELGFTHEGSAHPGLKSESCDWSRLPRICMPYKPSQSDYQSAGTVDLVMVPVAKLIRGGAASLQNEIGLGFLKAAFHEYLDLGMPVFHVVFHSPAMTSQRYQRVFHDFLAHIDQSCINFRLLSQVKAVRTVASGKRLYQYLVNADMQALAYIVQYALHMRR
jgi:hypothetical protein